MTTTIKLIKEIENFIDERGVVYAGYKIPSIENGNCYSYLSFNINPIPFDSYITIKFENDFMFNIQVCDSGIARLRTINQYDNPYLSFGAWYGAHIIIPVLHNPIESIVITAEVHITQPPCVPTKGWQVTGYSKGYRVMDPNGKIIWGSANPPHCETISSYKTRLDNTHNNDESAAFENIPCHCPVPTEPSPFPKSASLNYYSTSHVGVL
jgi:hypothetical protein